MARKHFLSPTLRPTTTIKVTKAVHRLSLVGVVDFPVRKLIIFMLLQLVLSPFILITADTLNGSTSKSNNQPASVPESSEQQFGFASNVNGIVNSCVKTNCTVDGFLTVGITVVANATERKTTNGNSILKQSENGTNEERPYDVDLSSTGNTSIHNQSRQKTDSLDGDARESRQKKRNVETFNEEDNGKERVLSRKRRYLIFPPGSSIQIVYDTYHPIVGYSNYLILGITAAMAWELPSKPIYLDEDLHNSYEMGQLPPLNRNDKNATNVQYVLPSNKKYSNTVNRIDSNYYYTNIPKQKFAYGKNKYHSSPSKLYYQSGDRVSSPLSYSVPNNLRPPSPNKLQHYVTYADSLMKQFKRLTEKIPQDRPLSTKDFQEFANILADNVKANSKSSYEKYGQRTNYAHIVHPVFRKRSIDELTPLDKFDLKLHRNSRHALYKQINTFLKTQGSDGEQCILKMLCETGQRKHNEEPGSMVVELLRAVFTLPALDEPTNHPEHKRYDEAHASTADCQQLYPNCKESVWNSKYM